MRREWHRGKWVLQLVRHENGAAVLYLSKGAYTVFHKEYGPWDGPRATYEAEDLADLGGLHEVP